MSDEGKSEVRFSPEHGDEDIIQAARQVLVDYGGDHDGTIHRSWRCFDKDRYPEPCDCLDEIAGDLVAAVRPLILNQAADAINHLNLGVDDRQSPHLQRGESNGLHRAENWLRDDALRDAARAVGVGGQHTDTPPAHRKIEPRSDYDLHNDYCVCGNKWPCGAGTPEATDG